MKCPLLLSQAVPWESKEINKGADCLKEECAWWNDDGQTCAIYTLAMNVLEVHNILTEIADKMPHEVQFRR